METSIRALSRDEITEAMTSLDALEGLIGAMPYRDGVQAVAMIETVRDTIGYCLPGGYAGECVGCGQSMGGEELGVADIENGGDLCLSCTPSDEEIAAQQLEDGVIGPGWQEWSGGLTCPVSPEADVRVQLRANGQDRGKARAFRWQHLGTDGDIVGYMLDDAPAHRSDGGLNILTRHSDIRNGAPRDT